MDTSAFNAGKAAYTKGDYATAQAMLQAAKNPGEINGALDHMLGNSLMRMGMYQEAAKVYQNVLKDETYQKVGAIYANLGRALAACGQDEEAIRALDSALQDVHYQSPYKAQMALGKLLQKRGDARSAGAAFRSAAIDERNPDPSVALMNLGSCFMELGRPLDAVEAFRTALDFSSPRTSQSSIYAALGEAFVASNRMQEALDAFQHALSSPAAEFTGKQEAAYTAAKHAVATLVAKRGGIGSTDALLAAGGYQVSGSIDPLDPLQESGELIPSPEDTGFFSVSEQDIMEEESKKNKEEKRSKKSKKKQVKKVKKKGRILKVFVVIIVSFFLLGAAGATWAYYQGYGIPDATTVAENLFYAKADRTGTDQYIASSVNDTQKKSIQAILPTTSNIRVKDVQRSKDTSIVTISASLSQGASQTYVVNLIRDGLGWKVTDVSLTFDTPNLASSSTDTSATNASSLQSSNSSVATSNDNSLVAEPGSNAVVPQSTVTQQKG